jgi:hypothetical protein
MARPRRPYSEHTTVARFDEPYMTATGAVPGTRQRARWLASTHFSYPTPNGIECPMTYMLVLDALMNIDPFIELRAKNLVLYLTETYPQLSWDSVTVGRVVSDFCDNFEDVLGVKNGLLERSRDHNGWFYLLHQSPETARLAFLLRDDLFRLTEVEIASRKQGRKTDFKGSPLLECVSVRGAWNSPLREERE